jgi:hypothetical protein
MLDRTFSVALASGRSVGPTSSGDIHERVLRRGGADADDDDENTASRNRATVSAANMSPVPLKKQSNAGTSMRNSRGEPSERVVEPMIVSVVGGVDEPRLDSWTDVTITCGTEYVL